MRVLEQHLYLITLLSKIWFLLQWHQVKGETFNGTWTYFLKIVTFDLHLFSLVTFSSSSFIKTNINPKAFVCRMVWIWWRISWLITGKFASNKTLRSVLPPSLCLSLCLSASNMKKEIPWFVWTIYPDWVTFCHWEVYDREVSIWAS